MKSWKCESHDIFKNVDFNLNKYTYKMQCDSKYHV